MEPRRWWLLAGAVPVALACAAPVGNPALRPLGDAAVALAGLAAAVVIRCAARSRDEHRRSWQLLAVAPLLPALGHLVAVLVGPADVLQLVVLRWLPTVPAYLVAIVAVLTLVGRDRLRAGGLRVGVEVALFLTACLVGVQLLVVGPGGRWSSFGLGEQFVLGGAVVATSATMAAALTLLGVIEGRRQTMALALFGATVLLTGGRGLGTSAMLSGTPGGVEASRFLLAGGLCLLALAPLVDRGADSAPADAPASGRSTELGQLLPHVAMVLAVTVVGAATMLGHVPSGVTVAGAVLCVVLAAAHRWVSARDERRMAARLRRSEAYFRSLVRSSGDAVVIVDDALTVSWASPALERALGGAAGDLVGRPLLDAVHPDDAATLAAALAVPTSSGPEPGAGLLLLRLADAEGVWRYLEAGISDLRDHVDVGAVVLHCRDMTDRHAREQALQSVAYTDPMTGLPNRAGLLRELQAAVGEPAAAPSTLLTIELNGLAAAREHAGRERVRMMVTEIGQRLRGTVRVEDVVARMGGGAFAVLASGDDADVDRLAARCLAVVERPIPTPSGIVELTAGIGLVPLDDGLGVEALLARADLAVRAAHAAGVGSAVRFRPELGEAADRLDRLRNDLAGACAREELFLLFQPIVSLQERRITGIEAMLRWRHPTLGEIPPAEFLLVAERAGVIGDLLRWALQQATAAVVTLPSSGAPLRMGMKLPAGYVATGTLVTDVRNALDRSGLAPERLVLQLNAAAVAVADERVGLDVSALRFLGVNVAVEGFGGGSSALSDLTRLPTNIVKLDRALITRIDRDPQMRALCASVVGVGLALNLDVVAEGVETAAQLTALCEFGVGFAQGYLISRPVPLGELTAILSDNAGALWPGMVSRA
ncbi:phosphodiesterase [Blastococcus sp. CT_GayMR19]|uniref:putative bifunctional diguanylate cyclase/phosphodiesterase n=1 Tax=Blastococcus sp. CT_GayMR19 TaxID=2559608 RepID=UPI0010734F2B|nr:GGDEF domain-containing phosphodiesterase [Blastococcus sp. CT_GayMR19]TFV71593.1 phosphodiesterase [Blastococcus sp. CT_GayMR19]